MAEFARDVMKLERVQLQIEPENAASMGVAKAAGFRLSDEPLLEVTEKGRVCSLCTWVLDL